MPVAKETSKHCTTYLDSLADANGKILTKTEDQLARWRNHFKQILNRPPTVDPPELIEGPTLNIRTNAITKGHQGYKESQKWESRWSTQDTTRNH